MLNKFSISYKNDINYDPNNNNDDKKTDFPPRNILLYKNNKIENDEILYLFFPFGLYNTIVTVNDTYFGAYFAGVKEYINSSDKIFVLGHSNGCTLAVQFGLFILNKHPTLKNKFYFFLLSGGLFKQEILESFHSNYVNQYVKYALYQYFGMLDGNFLDPIMFEGQDNKGIFDIFNCRNNMLYTNSIEIKKIEQETQTSFKAKNLLTNEILHLEYNLKGNYDPINEEGVKGVTSEGIKRVNNGKLFHMFYYHKLILLQCISKNELTAN